MIACRLMVPLERCIRDAKAALDERFEAQERLSRLEAVQSSRMLAAVSRLQACQDKLAALELTNTLHQTSHGILQYCGVLFSLTTVWHFSA